METYKLESEERLSRIDELVQNILKNNLNNEKYDVEYVDEEIGDELIIILGKDLDNMVNSANDDISIQIITFLYHAEGHPSAISQSIQTEQIDFLISIILRKNIIATNPILYLFIIWEYYSNNIFSIDQYTNIFIGLSNIMTMQSFEINNIEYILDYLIIILYKNPSIRDLIYNSNLIDKLFDFIAEDENYIDKYALVIKLLLIDDKKPSDSFISKIMSDLIFICQSGNKESQLISLVALTIIFSHGIDIGSYLKGSDTIETIVSFLCDENDSLVISSLQVLNCICQLGEQYTNELKQWNAIYEVKRCIFRNNNEIIKESLQFFTSWIHYTTNHQYIVDQLFNMNLIDLCNNQSTKTRLVMLVLSLAEYAMPNQIKQMMTKDLMEFAIESVGVTSVDDAKRIIQSLYNVAIKCHDDTSLLLELKAVLEENEVDDVIAEEYWNLLNLLQNV